jgi:lysophospholipase L1-like esterase
LAGPADTVGIIGICDSITNGQTGSQDFHGPNSYLDQLAVRSNGRYRLIHNSGVNGDTSTGCLARLATDVFPYKALGAQLVFVLVGTNDITGIPFQTTMRNISAIYTAIQNAGMTPIALTLPPRNFGGPVTLPMVQEIDQINFSLYELCLSKGVRLINIHDALADPTNKFFKTGYNLDATHPNGIGTRVMATTILNALGPATIYSPAFLAKSNVDYGNLIQNPLFIAQTVPGTPDNWTLTGTTSVSTDTTIIGSWLNVTNVSTAYNTITVVPGHTLSFFGRVKTSGVESGAATWSIYLLWGDGSITLYPAYQWTADVGIGYFYGQIVVPNGITTAYPLVKILSGTGVLSVAQVGVIDRTAQLPTY